AKVREFLTLKQDSLSVYEYGLKFTQLSRYASKMVVEMRSRISMFVVGLSRLSSKEGTATMLIGYMDISRLIVYVHQVEEEKLRDREEFRNKKAKTENEFGQQKGNMNRSSFQQKQKGPAPSSASAPAPKHKGYYNGHNSQNFRARPTQSQGNVNRSSFQQKQKGHTPSSASAPTPKNKGYYNVQNSQNFRARPAQSQDSVA
ncbi:hypothetical protein H5410_005535, partial [Solanum commersonii]